MSDKLKVEPGNTKDDIQNYDDDDDNNDVDDIDEDNDDDEKELEPSLQNIVDQESLKWIFVGGKGGVGKTTTSCSLAVLLASKRKGKVLIISTDPAHNLSDAFGQQFGPVETQVKDVDNLYAMEIDPKIDLSSFASGSNANANNEDLLLLNQDGTPNSNKTLNFLQEISSSVPGIDEAMSFAELMKQIKKKDYECVILDTAPTGHTLRLLSFPNVLEKAIVKLDGLRTQFGGLFQNFTNLLAQQNNNNANGNAANMLAEKLEDLKSNVAQIKSQFENYKLTTFVCVCIPEFLSLYETERLVQKLAKFNIDTHNIVINQVLFPEKDSNCKRCLSRVKMQNRYIEQFHDLYPDFHLIKMPLLSEEVRHIPKLRKFANLLLNPYNPQNDDIEKVVDID